MPEIFSYFFAIVVLRPCEIIHSIGVLFVFKFPSSCIFHTRSDNHHWLIDPWKIQSDRTAKVSALIWCKFLRCVRNKQSWFRQNKFNRPFNMDSDLFQRFPISIEIDPDSIRTTNKVFFFNHFSFLRFQK